MKVALITGITGQDGSYLAEFLLGKGYEVHGVMRRSSSFNTGRIEHLYLDEWIRDMHEGRSLHLHYGDMTDSSSLLRILQEVKPDEVYNLAAQSHVKVSFEVPEYTAETVALGTLRLLEALGFLEWEIKCGFTKPVPRNFLGKWWRVRRMSRPPFDLLPPMRWRSSMPTGFATTTERAMACM